jgi:hypothetical protein
VGTTGRNDFDVHGVKVVGWGSEDTSVEQHVL